MPVQEWKLSLLNDYPEKWARNDPHKAALIQHEDGKTMTYKQFNTMVDLFALRLLDLGIEKGDARCYNAGADPRACYLNVCLL